MDQVVTQRQPVPAGPALGAAAAAATAPSPAPSPAPPPALAPAPASTVSPLKSASSPTAPAPATPRTTSNQSNQSNRSVPEVSGGSEGQASQNIPADSSESVSSTPVHVPSAAPAAPTSPAAPTAAAAPAAPAAPAASALSRSDVAGSRSTAEFTHRSGPQRIISTPIGSSPTLTPRESPNKPKASSTSLPIIPITPVTTSASELIVSTAEADVEAVVDPTPTNPSTNPASSTTACPSAPSASALAPTPSPSRQGNLARDAIALLRSGKLTASTIRELTKDGQRDTGAVPAMEAGQVSQSGNGNVNETQGVRMVDRPDQEEPAVGIVSRATEGDDVVMANAGAESETTTARPIGASNSAPASHITSSAPVPNVPATATASLVATTSNAPAPSLSQPLGISNDPFLQSPIPGLSMPQWGELIMFCLSPRDRQQFVRHSNAALPHETLFQASKEARKLLAQYNSSGELDRLFEIIRASLSRDGGASAASSAEVTSRSSPGRSPGRSLAQANSATHPHSQSQDPSTQHHSHDQRLHGAQPQHQLPPQFQPQPHTQSRLQPQSQPVPVRLVQVPQQSGVVTVRVNPQNAHSWQQQQQVLQQQRSSPHQQARPLKQQLIRPQPIPLQSQPRSQPQVHPQAQAQVQISGHGQFRAQPPPLAIQLMPNPPSGVGVQPVHYVSPGGTVRPAPAPVPAPATAPPQPPPAPALAHLPTPVHPVGSGRLPTPIQRTESAVTNDATASSPDDDADEAAAKEIERLWSTGMEQVSQRMQESWNLSMQVGQKVVTAVRKELQMAGQRRQASAAARATELGALRLELAQTKAKHLDLHAENAKLKYDRQTLTDNAKSTAETIGRTRAALHATTTERDGLRVQLDNVRSGSVVSVENVTNAEIVRLKDQLQKRTDRMREIEEDKKGTIAAIEEENARKVSEAEKERNLERKRADRARKMMEENKAEQQDEIDKLKSKVEVLNRSLAHAEEMVANQVQQPSQSTPAIHAENQSMVEKVMKSIDSIRALLDLPTAGELHGKDSPLSQHLDFAHRALDSTLTATKIRLSQSKADGRAEKTAEAEKALAEAAKAVVERKHIEEDLAIKVKELAELKAAVSRHESERKAIQDRYDAMEAAQSASTETLRAELEAERTKTKELDSVKTKVAEMASRLVKFKADSEALDEARAKIKSLEEQMGEHRQEPASALEGGGKRGIDELADKLDEANSELLSRRSKDNELEDEVRRLKAEIERVRHDNKSLSESVKNLQAKKVVARPPTQSPASAPAGRPGIATSAPKSEASPKRKASETSQSTPAKKGLVIDLSDDGFTSSRPWKTSTISPKEQALPSTSSRLKRAVPRASRPQAPLFENAPEEDEDDEDNEVVLRPQRKRSRVDSPVATSVPAPPVPKSSSATATAIANATPKLTTLKSSVSQQRGTATPPVASKFAPPTPPAPPQATPLKTAPALSSQQRQSIEVSGTTTQASRLASPASSAGDFEPVSMDWVDRNLDLCFKEAVKGSGHWICKLCYVEEKSSRKKVGKSICLMDEWPAMKGTPTRDQLLDHATKYGAHPRTTRQLKTRRQSMGKEPASPK